MICLLGSLSVNAQNKRFHVFGALGYGYSPSSLRFAVGDIEAGLLNMGTNGNSVGAIKLFNNDSSFAGFGLAYRGTMAIGFHGAVGKRYRWFSWLNFRIELNGEVYTDSFTQGSGLLGWEVLW